MLIKNKNKKKELQKQQQIKGKKHKTNISWIKMCDKILTVRIMN